MANEIFLQDQARRVTRFYVENPVIASMQEDINELNVEINQYTANNASSVLIDLDNPFVKYVIEKGLQ